MGGLAVAAWRHARATHDVDMLVCVDPPPPDQLLRWAQEVGFRPKRFPALVEIPPHRFYQLMLTPKGMYLDIQVDFLFAETEFLRNAVDRAITSDVPSFGKEIKIVSCEDLIVLKLSADRILDRMDVRYLLEYNRETLDFAYLTRWINRLRLQKEWIEWWDLAFPGEPAPTFNPPSAPVGFGTS
jgi:hypothetical protein